jgi:hypothetical protein
MTIDKAMLLIGSPRGWKSNSHSLGAYLMGRLEDSRVETSTWLTKEILSSSREQEFLEEFDDTDILVLVFPLYIDSLPAMNIRLMKTIAEHRSSAGDRKRFMAIVNSGFPESQQCEMALNICRLFAKEANMEWMGGLALGGGMMIGAKPIKELGGMGKNIVKALDKTSTELANDRPVPMEAKRAMGAPIVPRSMFKMFGNRGWKKIGKNNGLDRLDHTPYRR